MKFNPFRKKAGVLPSYLVGREKELKELREVYQTTKEGVPEHIIFYGQKGIGKTSLLLKF